MKKGVLSAVIAYALWGIFPVYFKALNAVPALQILAHRVVWSFVLLAAVLLVRREVNGFRKAALHPRMIAQYALAAVLLAVNWGMYVWGVNAGYVVQTSLGYFINPLVSVLLGVFFLKERLRPLQWLAVGMAALGVLYLTISAGELPWIALVLAFSFGLYGLVKKTSPLAPLYGLSLETVILFLPGLAALIAVGVSGTGAFGSLSRAQDGLMILSGVVTVIPLLLFATATRSVPLSTIGLLQYIAPTTQLLLGVFLYHEPFSQSRLIGFSIIWAGLLLLSGETLRGWLRTTSAPANS